MQFLSHKVPMAQNKNFGNKFWLETNIIIIIIIIIITCFIQNNNYYINVQSK